MASLSEHKQVSANRPELVEGCAAQQAGIIFCCTGYCFCASTLLNGVYGLDSNCEANLSGLNGRGNAPLVKDRKLSVRHAERTGFTGFVDVVGLA